MKFEIIEVSDRPHRITLESDEIMVVGAVFRELIYNLSQKGNSGSISNYDADVALWKPNKNNRSRSICLSNYTTLTERLEDFHTNTDDAISQIPEQTSIPAYKNEDIPRRYRLGQKALDLASKIHEAATAGLRAEEISEEFAEYLKKHHDG